MSRYQNYSMDNSPTRSIHNVLLYSYLGDVHNFQFKTMFVKNKGDSNCEKYEQINL